MGLEIYWEAFLELSSCRSAGFSLGSIPWTAIKVYADSYDIVGEEFERFHALVRGMDAVYLEHHVKKSKRENG